MAAKTIAAPATKGAQDPIAEAKHRLFPPLRNRTLAEAAEALGAGDLATAEPMVVRFLEKKPGDPDALNLMADIARRSKRFDAAEELLARCVTRFPENLGYRFNYAVILRGLDKYEEALAELDILLKKDPRNPLFREQKAGILRKLDRHDEALAYRGALAEEYPRSPEIWLHYGHSLRNAGLQEQCIAAYRKALELAPSLSAAYGSLADLKVYRFTASEIASMEGQLAAPGLPADERADFCHALGKAHEDEKNYAKSFEHYAKGNALRRLGRQYSAEKLTLQRRACEEFFTEAFFRARNGWGCDASDPIFIVGMPRSGSTLLEQILSSHSAIEGVGELSELDMALVGALAPASEQGEPNEFGTGAAVQKVEVVKAYLGLPDGLENDRLRAVGELYLELTGRRRTTARPFFTDKTLSNHLYLGLIQLALPKAKIIDIRRHPLDCGWSCFKSQFALGGQPFSHKLSDIGHYYANYVALMAHFDAVLPGRIYRLIYENLLANPREELARLFDYLDLPFEETCLRFHENRRAVATLSSEQVRRPLYKSGVGQWLPYEPWLGPLRSALGPVLDCYPDPPPLVERPAASPPSNSGTAG